MSSNPVKYNFILNNNLSNKNNIHHGITLLLAILSLQTIESSPAYSAPIEQQLQTDPISAKTEKNSESVFGQKGQGYWYIQGSGATTLDSNEAFPRSFGLVGAGLSHFLFNGHSINLELNSLYFSQPDDDALGLNLNLLMRWHFIRQSNWSLFVDGGAGILGTTSDVPSTGASFNFTPQVGGGATIKLSEKRRLMLGLRWHHISHADLLGNNPGRDSIQGLVGIRFSR